MTLGLRALSNYPEQALVAVTTGIDLEKDRALCTFLGKHTEIDTLKPEVLNRLGKLSSGLSSVEQGAAPVSLCLLQTTVVFDQDHQALCARVAEVLAKPPDTLLTPTLSVRGARILLSDFLRVQEVQQAGEKVRLQNDRLTKARIEKQVADQQQALAQQESVSRLRQAGRSRPALPGTPATKGKTTKKTPATKAKKAKTTKTTKTTPAAR